MEYKYPFKGSSEALKKLVWEKGEKIPHYQPSIWRWDKYGKVMKYSKHGDIESKFGWEIDHIYPKKLGGTDDLDNLQPLQWKNNRLKSDLIIWNGNKRFSANFDSGLLLSWISRSIKESSINFRNFLRGIIRNSIYH